MTGSPHTSAGLLVVGTTGLMKLCYGTSNNLLLSDTVGNVITNYTYDGFGALASKEVKSGAAILYHMDFVRDSLSRIIEKTENVQGSAAKYDYRYDDVGRLWQVRKNDTLISKYQYDANGNRLAKITPTDTASGVYDEQDRLLTYSTSRYYYSSNGDLMMKVDTSAGDTTRYSYDAFGSLRGVKLPDGTNLEYIIDGSGRRVGRKVNGVVTQKWLYSSDLGIAAELDSANNIVSRFVYISSENVPEYFTKSGVLYRVVTDHLGSVKQVINAQTGAIVQSIDYDEFGNILVDTNPGFTPFGFAGGVYDNLSKLVRFGARDYDANVGRWTCKDPIRFNDKSSNLFRYVACDPVNSIDLNGLYSNEELTYARNSLEWGALLYVKGWTSILAGYIEIIESGALIVEALSWGGPMKPWGVAAGIGGVASGFREMMVGLKEVLESVDYLQWWRQLPPPKW
jgi:RHS repeat-associated protein